jgi:RimJ/RimL family protein N-acetyltransferase
MRFYVEPSPSGTWYVKLDGHDAPVSRHDSEEEAIERRDAYARGTAREEDGELVELRDGATVRIRPIRPDDKPRVLQAFDALGARSRYRRFLGYKKELSTAELESFTEIDHVDHEALAAVDPATGDGLGIARYVRLDERRDTAEAAVTVVDAWQGRGLGTALLERLAAHAREEGIREFTATLLSDNRAVLAIFRRLGVLRVVRDGPVQEIDVCLPVGDGDCMGEALRVAARGDVTTA